MLLGALTANPDAFVTEDDKWYQAGLRAFGSDVEPDEWTASLELTPRYSARAGDHFRQNPRYAVHQTNIWTHDVTENSAVPFSEQFPPLLDHLEARAEQLAHLLDRGDVEAELFLGFSSGNGQGGAFFPPDLVARIGSLGLAINLDLYPPGRSLALRRYERARALK